MVKHEITRAPGVASEGLYDPSNEHDACGLGFVAHLKGEKSHRIVRDGVHILENLEHRGATGADPLVGDGAGMLVQIPHDFFQAVTDFDLPDEGDYGLGFFFMPQDETLAEEMKATIVETVASEGLSLIGWRAVPCDNAGLSQDPDIQASEPVHWQGFFARPAEGPLSKGEDGEGPASPASSFRSSSARSALVFWTSSTRRSKGTSAKAKPTCARKSPTRSFQPVSASRCARFWRPPTEPP